MMGFLADSYLWLKALHVISVIAWMAGLFYLPRLFVYHAQVSAGSEMSETFKVMEGKLLRIIMNPAMIATWLFAIGMIVVRPDFWLAGWFHAKLPDIVNDRDRHSCDRRTVLKLAKGITRRNENTDWSKVGSAFFKVLLI